MDKSVTEIKQMYEHRKSRAQADTAVKLGSLYNAYQKHGVITADGLMNYKLLDNSDVMKNIHKDVRKERMEHLKKTLGGHNLEDFQEDMHEIIYQHVFDEDITGELQKMLKAGSSYTFERASSSAGRYLERRMSNSAQQMASLFKKDTHLDDLLKDSNFATLGEKYHGLLLDKDKLDTSEVATLGLNYLVGQVDQYVQQTPHLFTKKKEKPKTGGST